MPQASFQLALEKLKNNTLLQYIEALESLLIYVGNLAKHPEDKRFRKIRISNIHYQERLGSMNGSDEAMEALGFVQEGEYYIYDPKELLASDEIVQEMKEYEKYLSELLQVAIKERTRLPLRLENSHVYSSVSGVAAFSHIGLRATMEDDEIVVDGFCGDSRMGYFGLYDGHGGRQVVNFVVKALHTNLEHQLKSNPNQSIPDILSESYLLTDGQVRRSNILHSGTTSVSCIIREEDVYTSKNDRTLRRARMLYCANVGDSRAVLARGTKAIRLTIDHKPSLPEEAKRITDAGGFIGKCSRVNGVLAISRALGDHMLKNNDIVTALPYTTQTELTAEDRYLLLACDGVWDVMEDSDAVDFVLKQMKEFDQAYPNAKGDELNNKLEDVAKALVQDALDKKSQDNITVMVIKL